MDWIVTTARTVDEAQTRALDLLGVDSADAEIQVIEEGKTGLFGRTKSEARVRARIKPKAPPAKEERRPSRGGDRNRGRGGKNSGGKGGNNRQGGGDRNNNNDGGRGRSNSSNNDGSGNTKAAAAGGGGGGNRGGGGGGGGNRDGGGRQRNRGGGGGGNRDGGNRDGGGRQRSDRNDRGRNNEDRVEMPVAEQRETLEAFVTGVAKGFDPKATVKLVEEGTTLQAQVHGEDLGRLIGNKASTLLSLEELSRTAMHRAAAGRRYHRIQVDVDDYRARRREALAKFAQDLAQSVADTGKSKAMEPMGAADRKLIHDAVAEIEGVETVSEGRDPRRYIVILATNASDEEE